MKTKVLKKFKTKLLLDIYVLVGFCAAFRVVCFFLGNCATTIVFAFLVPFSTAKQRKCVKMF